MVESGSHLPEIENLCRKHIKSQTLTDDSYIYIAKLLEEDCPRNPVEVFSLIGDFLTDGMVYTDEEAIKICELLSKILLEQKMIVVEQRDTIVADKLSNPVVLNQMSQMSGGVVKDDDFLDPFTGIDKTKANQNAQFEGGKLQIAMVKEAQKQKDALDKKIAEFMTHKQKIPPPCVKHDKGTAFIKDIMIPNVTIIVGGKTLLDGASLKLIRGRKYGLVGRNGIGKTCLINAISRGEIEKFPAGVHTLQVEQEIEGDDVTVLQHILNCDEERINLLQEMDDLIQIADDEMTEEQIKEKNTRILAISARLDLIGASTAEVKATQIATGIGFSMEDLHRPSNSFSGGWRMRIAIAKVIFSEPEILLLDEPTNHLDLPALIWLEKYITTLLDTTILIVSHARDFLDATCDEIIHFQGQKLTYYKGNFAMFEKTKGEKDKNAKSAQASQKDKISHIQKFIDKFRYNAKRATLVQSRIKAIQRIDLVADVLQDPTCVFMFPNPEKLSPPLCRLDEAKLGYGASNIILGGVNINIDLETRIALIGPNGAGKSTLVKSLTGDLDLIDGYRFIHNRLRVGLFTQHHMDNLDLRLSAVEQLMQKFPLESSEKFRQHLGSFGITGNMALRPMYLLSGGQKSRVSFAIITWEKPHILLLDEPTNHLDFDAINALIVALNNFEGGLVVVSHDEYFLSALCDRLYIVNKNKVKAFDGNLADYRKLVTQQLQKS